MKQPDHEHHNCCGHEECDSGLRNNYFKGKRLSAKSFAIEQDYGRERRQLLNRAVHGWGVVYGYSVKADNDGRIHVGSGLALDAWGRELVHAERSISVKDVYFHGEVEPSKDDGDELKHWLLSAHYAERSMQAVELKDKCGKPYYDWEYTCETVVFSLRQASKEECCVEYKSSLDCKCGTKKCCKVSTESDQETPQQTQAEGDQAAGQQDNQVGQRPPEASPETDCDCICNHLTGLDPKGDPHIFEELEGTCGNIEFDSNNSVPLACVELIPDDDCDGGWRFGDDIEACGPRQLVKRNDLLFDLIPNCDLTHIAKIGWEDWHRRHDPLVPFEKFDEAFGSTPSGENDYISDVFSITFSDGVLVDSLRPDCVAMTVMYREDSWRVPRRVPIRRIVAVDPVNGESGEFTTQAKIAVRSGWITKVLRDEEAGKFENNTRVEIEIRGDLIVDRHGRALDANPRGLNASPTGNGTPGGTFLSSFRVGEKAEKDPD